MRFAILCFATFSLVVFALNPLSAQDVSGAPAGLDEEQKQRETLSKRAQEIIESARFYKTVNREEVDVPVRKEPLLRHSDAERGEQGGAWLVGQQGRPTAVAVMWTKPQSTTWVFDVRSLTPETGIGASVEGNVWNPKTAGIEFSPLPNASKPSAVPNLRFSQMKQQARRFSGHEVWQGGRHELRLLARELHRYNDPENGIVDGALFSIAHNTNTECYLLIEVQERNGKPEWYYALGRFGFAELHINIDKKEVWSQPQVGRNRTTAGPRDAYCQIVMRRKIPPIR